MKPLLVEVENSMNELKINLPFVWLKCSKQIKFLRGFGLVEAFCQFLIKGRM